MTIEQKLIAMNNDDRDLFTEIQELRKKLQKALDENEEMRLKIIELSKLSIEGKNLVYAFLKQEIK